MPGKFKKRDKVVLIKQIELVNHLFIPVGVKGEIIKDAIKVGDNFYYSVNFEKFPDLSPQLVPENYMVPLKQEKINKDFLGDNPEFKEWLEGHVQKQIKEELLKVAGRGLDEELSKAKITRITGLTGTEVNKVQEGRVDQT